MASLSTIFPLRSYCSCNYVSTHRSITTATSPASLDLRFSFSSNPKERRVLEHVGKPLSAVGSGLEASITDPKDNAITLKNAEVVLESKEENKIQLRVDLPGDETQKVFDKVLIDLGRSAPPIPGFRRQKGGKTSKVPRDFLLQILGEERVTNFVIKEIVTSSIANYVKKENLNVKDNKVNTIQKAEELKKLFSPGNAFGFNAVLELEETKTDTSS
ncbi:hypothetical protein P3X46_010196 [Hevea brasiliensis]|uniref:Trigger factor ribosome-binding bacterial domain-containing protein n=1 Tax=Hevea brasiliensis TaxID=3981 RepID=A0ABQ9MFM8_HEVBR|nr:uncharacterized protein LOC110657428 isoform X1 [Hevea brasiliensis]KAJ9178302.1 hypothetical protein P3X46_010196 [Hevea brasiliensis]